MTSSNPLLSDWTTPFELPPFDAIETEHFKQAFDVALEKSVADVDRIAENDEAPTFENTIEAMERAGETLGDVAGVFFNLSGAHTNPDLQAIERDMAPRFADHRSKIMLNAALFARIDALYEMRKDLGLNAEQMRVLEKYHSNFVRAGAKLEGSERSRMAEVTKRLAVLGTSFSQNVLADESAYELVLESAD
ncbi:MAG: peptidase M3, partial [Pseudomonadota bacterium]